MSSRKIDNYIIIALVCAAIMGVAIVARKYVVDVLGWDDFSGFIAFLICLLMFGALYFSFQSIINEFFTPLLDSIFGTNSVEGNEEAPEQSTNTTSPTPRYSEYKNAAQERIAGEQQQTLDRVLDYTMETLSIYMSQSDMTTLCEHIRTFQFADEQTCDAIQTLVVVDDKIRPIDLMHFGWNIGNQFRKSGIETATFLKRVFAISLKDYVTNTIKSKLRMEGSCIIKLIDTIH